MIDATVTAQQQKSYEAGAGRYFDELKAQAEQPPVSEIRTELEKMLRMNSFTGPRYDLAATSDGSTIMAMGGMIMKEPSYYEPLTSLVLHSGLKVRLIRPITCCEKLGGIVIESSPGAYDQLLGAIAGEEMPASPLSFDGGSRP